MCKLEFCNKELKKETNALNEVEVIPCNKLKGHKGQCSFTLNKLGDIPEFVLKKVKRLCLTTMGAKKTSIIYNRIDKRWIRNFMTKKEENVVIGEYPGNSNSTHIRKDEWARAKDCVAVYRDMLNSTFKIYNNIKDEDTKCPICLDYITNEELLISGSNNPKGLQGCHIEPLSEKEIQHKGGNFKLGHRYCNIIQSDNTMEEMLKQIIKIAKAHGKI